MSMGIHEGMSIIHRIEGPLMADNTAIEDRQFTYKNEIEEYLDYLREHGRAERTIHTRRASLLSFFSYIGAHSIEEVTEPLIRAFISSPGPKESTKRAYVTYYGQMCKVLTGHDPTKDIDILWNRVNRKRLFISMSDYLRVLDSTKDRRVRLVLILGAYLGLRTVEIERLTTDDVKRDSIVIRGKGHLNGLSQEIPLPRIVKDELSAYMEWRKDHYDRGGTLLITKVRDTYVPIKEGNNSVYNMLKAAGKRANVTITPHSLRRLFATTLYYDVGTDIITVKELMRHAKSSTTLDNYIQAYPENRIRAMDRLTEFYSRN